MFKLISSTTLLCGLLITGITNAAVINGMCSSGEKLDCKVMGTRGALSPFPATCKEYYPVCTGSQPAPCYDGWHAVVRHNSRGTITGVFCERTPPKVIHEGGL